MDAVDDARSRMKHSLEAIRREFATVRTGKAVPSVLDTVRVSAYGGLMPLNQVATVSAPDPSLLVIQPFDRSLISDIEKAVLTSGLGLNPSNDGALIRVPIPPLSEERRKEYVRVLHRMAEDGRISVRQARQVANDRIREQLRLHETGEDDGHRQMASVQRLTDEYCSKINSLLAVKEKEVMAI